MQLKIRETLENYIRVLRIAKKPDMEEFLLVAKVCGIGIGVVGALGFVLFILSNLFIG